MQINTLKAKTKRITSARVGRGGTRGKTSGRGMKGQKARAGNSTRPQMRDILKKLPKRRGHGKNRSRTVRTTRLIYAPVNLAALEKAFNAGDSVSPLTLRGKKLVGTRGGYILPVKILGTGSLTKKLTCIDCFASASAKSAIEAAGGSVSHSQPPV
ncbi:MAG: large subunit ribosomal protein [Candidatus Parcubacteria bacterium]|jgi:large subunit ribosomal protein L15|nr:large subunit ribosomal protein [Candidatus Parcubacteria bacterium]